MKNRLTSLASCLWLVGMCFALTAFPQQPFIPNSLTTSEQFVGDDAPPAVANALDDEFNQSTFNSSQWTWVNQSTATATVNGSGFLELASTAANGQRMLTQSVPSAPYKFGTHLACGQTQENFHSCGITLRELATHKSIILYLSDVSNVWDITAFSMTDDIAGTAGTQLFTGVWYCGNTAYLQLERVSANINFYVGCDPAYNSTFRAGQAAVATYFTTAPDQVGLFSATSGSPATATNAHFYWFRRIS